MIGKSSLRVETGKRRAPRLKGAPHKAREHFNAPCMKKSTLAKWQAKALAALANGIVERIEAGERLDAAAALGRIGRELSALVEAMERDTVHTGAL